jgi:HAD superfamily hydrolase (TIGR01459 family)
MLPMLPPPILTNAHELLSRYDVLFCDVWGVVHDGHTAFPGAMRALTSFRAQGGTVILVSNAPVPPHQVARMLDGRAVPRTAWDSIVSSGGIALQYIAEQAYRSVYTIGPRDRDAAFFEAIHARQGALADADAIVCTGLNDEYSETAASYSPVLAAARERRLPFVCANPDLVVDVGGTHYLCAGSIAHLYEEMGGEVYWAGKPYLAAYASAHAKAEEARGSLVDPRRILAIGDAFRTDLKGAENAGIDALFIGSGIHKADTMREGALDPLLLAAAFSPDRPPAVAAMAYLDW